MASVFSFFLFTTLFREEHGRYLLTGHAGSGVEEA